MRLLSIANINQYNKYAAKTTANIHKMACRNIRRRAQGKGRFSMSRQAILLYLNALTIRLTTVNPKLIPAVTYTNGSNLVTMSPA